VRKDLKVEAGVVPIRVVSQEKRRLMI
jgi:hypothetical protein